MKRKWVTRTDLFLLLSLLAVLLAFALLCKPKREGDTVSVYVGNELYAAFSLADAPEAYTVVTEKGSLLLSFDGMGVAATHADCPDGICVRTGRISRAGESIVCAPLGICITVEGGSLDGVTG